MKTIRFIMLGGFLGAGKTTTLARLARHYMTQGRRVGIVTNDQAQDLVDTHSLREQGFPVEEVAGSVRREEIVAVLSLLTHRERSVLMLRFGLDDGHPLTLEEVGQKFGVTRERIRQIEAKTLAKLKAYREAQRLQDFLD